MDFVFDPSLVLYLPLYQLDGASFVSKDAYGHTCTVTGALWRPCGMWFDGADDVIVIPDATSIQNIFDGGGTAMAWINPASDGEADKGRFLDKRAPIKGWVCRVEDELGDAVALMLRPEFTGVDGEWVTTARDIPLNTWTFVAITYNADAVGNNPIFYINNTVKTVGSGIDEATTPIGIRGSDVGEDLHIGNSNIQNATFDGGIGEVGLYRRILTPLEIQHNYLATKWRYR